MRPALIWPVCLLAVLGAAAAIAQAGGDSDSRLLSDLANAAVDLDRRGALTAVARSKQSSHFLVWFEYLGAVATASLAACLLLTVAVLPAFTVRRRLCAALTDFEKRAFNAWTARRVTEVELDLVAWALLLPLIALPIALGVWFEYGYLRYGHQGGAGIDPRLLVIATGLIYVAICSPIELHLRYRERRRGNQSTQKPPWLRWLSRPSLAFLGTVTLYVVVGIFMHRQNTTPVELPVGVKAQSPYGSIPSGTFGDVSFAVTAVDQNVPCNEPHSALIPNPHYLRFTVEAWSSVDTFYDPASAHYLNLSHWSVLDSRKHVFTNLYMHAKCGSGVTAVAKPLSPGMHTITDVVISAPNDAQLLQLEGPPGSSTYRWQIPPIQN